MPLVECADCHSQISDAAPACPHCGRPSGLASVATSPVSSESPPSRKLSIKLTAGIIFFPLVFAWFTLAKGYSLLARISSFGWLLLTALMTNESNGEAVFGICAFIAFMYAIGALLVSSVRKSRLEMKAWGGAPKKQSPTPKHPSHVGPVFSKKGIDTASAKNSSGLSGYSHTDLLEIAFSYLDIDDNFTQREVSVNQVTGTYVKGWCHQRGAPRTFRIDSIISDVTLRSTGEVIAVDDWVKAVRKNTRRFDL